MMSRHLHTPLPTVMEFELDLFEHFFSAMISVMESEQPDG